MNKISFFSWFQFPKILLQKGNWSILTLLSNTQLYWEKDSFGNARQPPRLSTEVANWSGPQMSQHSWFALLLSLVLQGWVPATPKASGAQFCMHWEFPDKGSRCYPTGEFLGYAWLGSWRAFSSWRPQAALDWLQSPTLEQTIKMFMVAQKCLLLAALACKWNLNILPKI